MSGGGGRGCRKPWIHVLQGIHGELIASSNSSAATEKTDSSRRALPVNATAGTMVLVESKLAGEPEPPQDGPAYYVLFTGWRRPGMASLPPLRLSNSPGR